MADNGTERIERIEQELGELRQDLRILLRAQVLHNDKLDQHDRVLTRLESLQESNERRFEEIGKRFDDVGKRFEEMGTRIDNLVSGIGEYIRHERERTSAP
jgi:chromosome segregation ATPase